MAFSNRLTIRQPVMFRKRREKYTEKSLNGQK